MTLIIMRGRASLCLTLTLLVLTLARADAQPSPTKSAPFKVGDKVEGDYLGWYRGTITKVLYGGDQYELELLHPDGGKPFRYTLPAFKVRAATSATGSTTTATDPLSSRKPETGGTARKAGPPAVGKYGCTESRFNPRTGFVEYEMRGSFTLSANGTYHYPGMKSSGRYAYNAKTDTITFKGGYFDGATATYFGQKNSKFRLEFPSKTERKTRWTCGLIGKEGA